MLIPLDTVGDAWRQTARAEIEKIKAVGLSRNIPKALTRAIAGWHQPKTENARHLILLSAASWEAPDTNGTNECAKQTFSEEILTKIETSQAHIEGRPPKLFCYAKNLITL